MSFIPFLTRIPSTIKKEQQVIEQACRQDQWLTTKDKKLHYQEFSVNHYGLEQRWIVARSEESKERACKSTLKKVEQEAQLLEKNNAVLAHQEFSCQHDALHAWQKLINSARYHEASCVRILELKCYEKKGRPGPTTPFVLRYQLQGTFQPQEAVIQEKIEQQSCFVLGTSLSKERLNAEEVLEAYKKQNTTVERGFRFLKDPTFFTSSLFLKKPSRIEGLLMVMTLALFVYSLAQRRMRAYLEEHQETLPNQIKKEIQTPTLKWLFQLLEGIDLCCLEINGIYHRKIIGMNKLRYKILSCFGSTVAKMYGIDGEPDLAFSG